MKEKKMDKMKRKKKKLKKKERLNEDSKTRKNRLLIHPILAVR